MNKLRVMFYVNYRRKSISVAQNARGVSIGKGPSCTYKVRRDNFATHFRAYMYLILNCKSPPLEPVALSTVEVLGIYYTLYTGCFLFYIQSLSSDCTARRFARKIDFGFLRSVAVQIIFSTVLPI